MTKFTIHQGLNIYTGGLLGAVWLAQAGGSRGMIINNKISAFFIYGHWGLKRRDGKVTIDNRTLRKIARKVFGLKKFKIEKRRTERGIYNITEHYNEKDFIVLQ